MWHAQKFDIIHFFCFLFVRLLVEIRKTHNSCITNNIQVGFFLTLI